MLRLLGRNVLCHILLRIFALEKIGQLLRVGPEVSTKKKYTYAVLAKEVNSHLRGSPRHRWNFTRKQRQDMTSQIFNLPGILKDQNDLKNFEPPSADTTLIPFVEPPKEDGLACQQCPYVARQLHSIQKHCREEHE